MVPTIRRMARTKVPRISQFANCVVRSAASHFRRSVIVSCRFVGVADGGDGADLGWHLRGVGGRVPDRGRHADAIGAGALSAGVAHTGGQLRGAGDLRGRHVPGRGARGHRSRGRCRDRDVACAAAEADDDEWRPRAAPDDVQRATLSDTLSVGLASDEQASMLTVDCGPAVAATWMSPVSTSTTTRVHAGERLLGALARGGRQPAATAAASRGGGAALASATAPAAGIALHIRRARTFPPRDRSSPSAGGAGEP
jgi:hypothetical protein